VGGEFPSEAGGIENSGGDTGRALPVNQMAGEIDIDPRIPPRGSRALMPISPRNSSTSRTGISGASVFFRASPPIALRALKRFSRSSALSLKSTSAEPAERRTSATDSTRRSTSAAGPSISVTMRKWPFGSPTAIELVSTSATARGSMSSMATGNAGCRTSP
jgi:hypothetical protein